MKSKFILNLILLPIFISPAFAQTQLYPPDLKWGQQLLDPTPGQIVGYDSGSGLACIVGSVSTCNLAIAAGAPPVGGSTAANQTNVQGTIVPGTAPVNMNVGGGIYNSSPPAPTTGQTVALQVDASGNLRIAGATSASASGGAIAAGQATTTVKSGAGTLYAIVLNSAATATNVTTVYDNIAGSGTVIAIPAVVTATIPVSLDFGPTGLAFGTGLTVVTATANGGNMTFVYK